MYVEAFLVPVPKDKEAEYKALARVFGEVYLELGATRIVESWPDDVAMGEVTSFPRAVQAGDDEVAAFAWIEYPNKATRDACNEALMSHPTIKAHTDPPPFDGKRMIFGGYAPFLEMKGAA